MRDRVSFLLEKFFRAIAVDRGRRVQAAWRREVGRRRVAARAAPAERAPAESRQFVRVVEARRRRGAEDRAARDQPLAGREAGERGAEWARVREAGRRGAGQARVRAAVGVLEAARGAARPRPSALRSEAPVQRSWRIQYRVRRRRFRYRR